mmetsp:Transcript_5980/g.12999  ORF Transcript_5980/g.12999 Transcript_5980/m.12999 type:complete len:567 (+) Transcript_5980:425-2125(+)
MDPTGSRPKENEDSIRRRKLMMKKKKNEPAAGTGTGSSANTQEQLEGELIPDNFFYHTSQPFTSQEMTRLDKWLFKEKNNNSNINCGNEGDSDSFYENVAHKLRKEHHENPTAREKDSALLSTCVPRSAKDIKLYHRDRLASQHEFTKQESLAILEGVEETTGVATDVRREGHNRAGHDDGDGEADERNTDSTWENPDWEKICERVQEVHRNSRSGSSSNNTNPGQEGEIQNVGGCEDSPTIITPYKCMVHYKTKLRRRPGGSFTPEEDELLLRYIAAMGPQFIWGTLEIADLTSRLFPNKPVRRIYERTHCSQWHPLSKDTMWTKEEEQKLVLAMKVYSEVGSTANCESESGGDRDVTMRATSNRSGNDGDNDSTEEGISDEQHMETEQSTKTRIALEKAAIRKAAMHFHPQRQLYKVVKKWERSFSPRFSYRPFSKEEDARLLKVVKSSAAATPFSEIAKQHFPNRISDQLSQRWTKIAPDKDVVEKLVPFMIRSGVKRGLVAMKSSTSNTTNNETASGNEGHNNDTVRDDDNNGALFEPNDFVVEVLPNQGLVSKPKDNTKDS